jgi:transposase
MLNYASNKTVLQVVEDLDISSGMLYRWRWKYTPNGDKTRYTTMEKELKALKLETAQLKMERDM